MVRLLSILVLAVLQIASIDLLVDAHPSPHSPPQGCACRCETEQAAFRVWHSKYGPADRFAARTIGQWFNKMETNSEEFVKTELLILLGTSAKGVWSVETRETDAGGEIYIDLVCVTLEGKRKVFPVIKGSDTSELNALSLRSKVLRQLRRLARSGRWDPGSLIPARLPLPSKTPALVFRERGKPDDDKQSHSWSLSIRARNGRLARIAGERTPPGHAGYSFRDAKCFGGVADDANGVTWWILVKTAGMDNCSADWRSIRFTTNPPVKR